MERMRTIIKYYLWKKVNNNSFNVIKGVNIKPISGRHYSIKKEKQNFHLQDLTSQMRNVKTPSPPIFPKSVRIQSNIRQKRARSSGVNTMKISLPLKRIAEILHPYHQMLGNLWTILQIKIRTKILGIVLQI